MRWERYCPVFFQMARWRVQLRRSETAPRS